MKVHSAVLLQSTVALNLFNLLSVELGGRAENSKLFGVGSNPTTGTKFVSQVNFDESYCMIRP